MDTDKVSMAITIERVGDTRVTVHTVLLQNDRVRSDDTVTVYADNRIELADAVKTGLEGLLAAFMVGFR